MSVDDLVRQAVQQQQQGNSAVARKIYESLLRQDKNHFEALANLASMSTRVGDHKQARVYFKRALRINAETPELWFNFANLCQKLEAFETAETAFRKALKLNPELSPAWFNLGNLLRDRDQLEEAETCYLKAIELAPDFARVYMNLGNLLRKEKRLSEAVEHHQIARKLEPYNPDICLNLANALTDLKRFSEAATSLKEGLQISPGNAKILLALGRVLMLQGEEQAAIACYLKLLTKQPGDVDAHLNLGVLYFQVKENDSAVAHLRQAVELAPERLNVVSQLGFTLTELGQLTEARKIAEKLVARHPEEAQSYMLQGFVAVQHARIADGLEAFARIRELDPGAGIGVSNTCFSSLYADFLDAGQITQLHRDMSAKVVESTEAQQLKVPSSKTGGRIRVGYLSPDFRSHPVGYFMQPILENHDHEAFEIFGYGIQPRIDATGKTLIAHLDQWHHCAHWSDDELERQIRADGIDILVDLGGYTANCKMNVLARRVAPVQAVYLGYPCTTGMPEMDYIIADQWLIPPGSENLYSEIPARLETSFLCFQPRSDTPEVAPLPAASNAYVTFGSFNNLPKLSDRCVNLWSELLRAVPAAKLALKALALSDAGTKELVWQRFAAGGIDPERVELLGPTVPILRFLAEYRRIDIALDPVPYNGGTTSCDALWMGVPVVSLAGRHFHQRMGCSILNALGRPQWVADDEEAYIEIAAGLAADTSLLTGIRQGLRLEMQASPLLDPANFTAGLERQFQQMLAPAASA